MGLPAAFVPITSMQSLPIAKESSGLEPIAVFAVTILMHRESKRSAIRAIAISFAPFFKPARAKPWREQIAGFLFTALIKRFGIPLLNWAATSFTRSRK